MSVETVLESPSVTLTERAARRILEILREDSAHSMLRVAVTGGGCSGFQYSLNFDTLKEGDRVTDFGGVLVYVDDISLPYIAGTTLDYVEGLHGAGFRFDNPRASRTCGCGSSFSA